jgi:hypothetical protein
MSDPAWRDFCEDWSQQEAEEVAPERHGTVVRVQKVFLPVPVEPLNPIEARTAWAADPRWITDKAWAEAQCRIAAMEAPRMVPKKHWNSP